MWWLKCPNLMRWLMGFRKTIKVDIAAGSERIKGRLRLTSTMMGMGRIRRILK
jgi:hypothetical protein